MVSDLPAVLEARAKLTLSLRVTGRRDDGYHFIDAEMVTLDLADRLELEPGDGLEVTGAAGDSVPADDHNLVRRALAAAGRQAHVRLCKQIPAGAGLGGGSADAAAVLRWAGIDDLTIAAKLGADVPFCIVGGRAQVTGVGEEIRPLQFEEIEGTAYTLLIPPIHTSTRDVYLEWDAMGSPAGENGNDLECAAVRVSPELSKWRNRLGEATGEQPRLAGSGSTWFVEGAFPGEDRLVVRVARGSESG